MSKLSFRARALDASKPLPVYKTEEIPDLPDFEALKRAVPQMPTGMEKEEETVRFSFQGAFKISLDAILEMARTANYDFLAICIHISSAHHITCLRILCYIIYFKLGIWILIVTWKSEGNPLITVT